MKNEPESRELPENFWKDYAVAVERDGLKIRRLIHERMKKRFEAEEKDNDTTNHQTRN